MLKNVEPGAVCFCVNKIIRQDRGNKIIVDFLSTSMVTVPFEIYFFDGPRI